MKRVIISLVLVLLVLLAGCASVTVQEINADPDKYMGKKVTVTGTVIAPIQLGTISGFTLRSEKSSIMVSSDMVPAKDAEVTVRGTVVKGLFSTHYIFADSVK